MKIPSSWKFILGVITFLAVIWFGWKGYAAARLSRFEFTPIEPGEVNLIAVTPGQGYRIIVSNRMASLAETNGDTMSRGDDDIGETTNAKRLPIRELQQSLAGDEKALGYLVERINDIDENNFPPNAKTWKAADIRKALDGDPELEKQLIADLNAKLDGDPLPNVNPSALSNGIIIEVMVPVEVSVGGKVTTLNAPVRQHYESRLAAAFNKQMSEKFVNSDEEIVSAYLTIALEPRNNPESRENIRQSLESRINPDRTNSLGTKPERVLKAAEALINEDYMTGASVRTETLPNGRTQSRITINLTEEGRMRLWKYSHDNPGFQLLFTMDGYAIAAPRISTDLAERSITMTKVPDETLAKDAVDRINSLGEGS